MSSEEVEQHVGQTLKIVSSALGLGLMGINRHIPNENKNKYFQNLLKNVHLRVPTIFFSLMHGISSSFSSM